MKILMIASEMDGVVKTGGLADFAAALPKALLKQGHDVRVIMPKYKNSIFPATSKSGFDPKSLRSNSLYFNLNHSDHYGCLVHHANLLVSENSASDIKNVPVKQISIPVRLVEYHNFFSREGIYDDGVHPYQDNALRYAFLCKAALEQCLHERWIPDIIHCNDWQTALLPYYLKEHYLYYPEYGHQADDVPRFRNTRTILTIHNGDYQGRTEKRWLDALGIMPERFTSELMEEYGMLNLLKCGIMYADAVNAVSPGYCQELLLPESSHQNLSIYLNKRGDSFTGILNGCDYTSWNPEADPFLPHHFSAQDMAGKALCKAALQSRMRLPSSIDTNNKKELLFDQDVPLFGLISRLTAQKGFDYLIPALERLLYENAPVQIAMLGSGEPDYGSRLHHLEQRYPHKMSFVNGYDNGLSHLIEAGSDFFMMPSLFEPCGLNQLYSLAYGTIPIVRETGGLKDTVTGLAKNHANAHLATGIGFGYPDSHNCYEAIKQAISLYIDNKPLYLEMQRRAMKQKFTWDESARQYQILYKKM